MTHTFNYMRAFKLFDFIFYVTSIDFNCLFYLSDAGRKLLFASGQFVLILPIIPSTSL